MGKKKAIGIIIGVIILGAAAGIGYQNYEYAKQAKGQVDELSAAVKQKDMKIMELTKEVQVKQAELDVVKAELDSIKSVLDNVKTQINTVTEQPAMQEPQAVTP